jgi:hypothetical protein
VRSFSVLLAVGLALSSFQAAAQTKTSATAAQLPPAPPAPPAPPEDSGWRISPEKINIQLGDDRWLQVLDDAAQELQGAVWSVDDPERVDLRLEEFGRAVLRAKAVGTVRVRATIGAQTRVREIKIWPASNSIPDGTTSWALHPIGRELGDLPAVPVDGAQVLFSLEQTPAGTTYLRADRDDGIQVWTWLMPGGARDVELVCGDWLGGAVISANDNDSYTIYAVGHEGALRWQYDSAGHRKGHAISTDHLVHLLSQSSDGTVARLTGLDESSGQIQFDITLPSSGERRWACADAAPRSFAPLATCRIPRRLSSPGCS